MGRPSRKTTASTIILEDPYGEVYFFLIDGKGNSNLLGTKHQSLNENAKFTSEIPPNLLKAEEIESKKNICSDQKSIDQKNINLNDQHSNNNRMGMKNFDEFMKILDSQINITNFLRDFKLSDNMLPV